jgi:hypothetical protein
MDGKATSNCYVDEHVETKPTGTLGYRAYQKLNASTMKGVGYKTISKVKATECIGGQTYQQGEGYIMYWWSNVSAR